MKTIEAELVLLRMFKFHTNIIVPGVTTLSQLVKFESDILVLTDSGYATSIEIKVSKADLRNDLKKKHILKLDPKYSVRATNSKEYYYGRLKHFYYAVPVELIEVALEQIPSFSGLINLSNGKIVRKPEKLFNYKWTKEELLKLCKLGTMRINNLKQNIAELNQWKPRKKK